MDPLTLIGKMIGTTARVGGAVSLAALAIYFFHNWGVKPFALLDEKVIQAVIVGGVVGAGTVLVESLLAAWNGAVWLSRKIAIRWAAHKAKARRKEQSLKNLRALTYDQALMLCVLKQGGNQRFYGENEDIYRQLRHAQLLEIDDQNYSVNHSGTYYCVPQHIWEQLDEVAIRWKIKIP